MIITVFNVFMTFSVVVGFLFIFATQFSRYRLDKPIVFLNLFVLSFTLYNLQRYLIINKIIYVNYFIDSLPFSFYSLIVPFFYTFTVHYLGIENKVNSFIKIAIISFLLQVVIRIALFPSFFDVDRCEVIGLYAQYEEVVNAIFAVFLYSRTFYLVFFRTDLYQEVLSFDSIQWIKTFLLLGALVLITWIIAIVFNINNVITPSIPLYYPLRFSTFLLLLWLCYHGYFNYSFLSERKRLRIEIANETLSNNSFGLSNQMKHIKSIVDKDFNDLNDFILKNELYMDPNLTLDMMSKNLKITERKIASTIQKNANLNFTDYINSIRIEKAKKLLQNPNYNSYTNLAIGLECGFNSKSTYYRAFSKFTRTTPTDFRL